jgi:hypothetical protein
MAVEAGHKSAISKGAVINALFVFIMGAGYVNRWHQNPSSRAHVDTYATLEPWWREMVMDGSSVIAETSTGDYTALQVYY